MKFLVDAQLPPRLANWLRTKGFDADHVEAVGLRDAKDEAIRLFAKDRGYVLVTKDRDFVRRDVGRPMPQVVWLRLGNASTAIILELLERSWPGVVRRLREGNGIVEVR